MQIFIETLIWNLVIAGGILLTIFLLKKFVKQHLHFLNYIIALTIGLLLWIIFLGFIPKASDHLAGIYVWVSILVWLFFFYVLELFLHWHHCKDLEHCHKKEKEHKHWFLIFWWTLLHNALHWIVLFSAFSVSLSFWIATTLAILLHSIPQNVVNYIMNHNQEKFAYIAAIGGILWAILTYPFMDFLLKNKFIILSFIAGWLLYTALADIFPEIKENWDLKTKIIQLTTIILWIFSFLLIEYLSKLI